MSSHALTGRHLINGQWHNSPATFTAHNPTTGEKLSPLVSEAGGIEAERAVTSAAEAQAMTQDFAYDWPAKFLTALAEQIMALGDTLLEKAEQETALPRARLTGERARTVNQLKMFADVAKDGAWVDAIIDTADPNRQPPKPDIRRMLRPRGPVVVFAASNFPFAFGALGGDTASALAARCPVVVKAHPSHPGTSELFAAAALAALDQLNYPRGLFSLLHGTTKDLGAALVTHPYTTAVAFTGSLKAGRALFELANQREDHPIPVYAEMGSVNPLVITHAALRERGESIAKDLAASILLGGGQFCTKPGLILPIGDNAQAFIAELLEHLRAAPPVVMLNQNLRNAFDAKTKDFADQKGVRPLLSPAPSAYATITPGLYETDPETFLDTQVLHEEAFGPAALVIPCRELHDAVQCARAVEGSLTASLHLGENERPSTTAPLMRGLESIAGRLIINGYPTGVEVCRAMQHGGPYPATTDPATTSVGTAALTRFARPVAFQSTPDHLLPPALQNANPLGIARTINGQRTTDPIA